MNYKGYELRNDAKTIFHKDGQNIEVQAWGIYANGDFRGSAKTIDAAKDFIDEITRGTLYRPPITTRKVRNDPEADRARSIMERNGKERHER